MSEHKLIVRVKPVYLNAVTCREIRGLEEWGKINFKKVPSGYQGNLHSEYVNLTTCIVL